MRKNNRENEHECTALEVETALDAAAIEAMLRNLPQREPPADLSQLVMDRVSSRSIPSWKRFYRWCAEPRSVTFSLLNAAAVTAVLILGLSPLIYTLLRPTTTAPLSASASRELTPVMLTLSEPGVQSVAVIGSFNHWQPKGYNMHYDKEQKRWVLTLRLPPGRHQYAFLVNQRDTLPDPSALMQEDDGFGTRNSVLIIGNNHESSQPI